MNRSLTAGLAALFVLSLLLPPALADNDDRRHGSSDGGHGKKSRDHGPHGHAKGPRGNFTLALDANGTRDNATYTLHLLADGVGREKQKDDNLTKLKGRATAHVSIRDGNGTVLREADVRVQVHLQRHADGNWTWHLEAVGKKSKHTVKLELRGNATATDGAFDLAGDGKVVFKPEGQKRPVRVDLDATGRLGVAASP